MDTVQKSKVIIVYRYNYLSYGTAHVQVYKKTRVILRDSENFEDNSRVRRVRHEEYIARE